MTLKKFNKNYIYQTDKQKFGSAEVWEVIEPNEEGKYLGNCESYMPSLKKYVTEFKDTDLYLGAK